MAYWLARAKSSLLLVVLLGLLALSSGSCGVLPNQQRVSLAIAARGVNADISAMISGTPYSITTTNGGNFFDLAAQLGINTLRITDIQWEMTGKEYSHSSWRYVFDEAADHHMNIILLLMDGNGHPASQQAHTLLETYGLAHAPALWMVDLSNEPDLSDPQVMAALSNEATYVRQIALSAYITIGGWKSQVPGHPGEFDWENPADIPKLINLVDVVSPHLYGFDQAMLPGLTPQKHTRDYLSEVRLVSQNKPILLEEFGASNGLATT
ncbi:MAG: glycoside hydrolase family 5 protein, partial [Chloroflexota bacterium]|nr:glycoside hydrolase family 5 protein [Chloroflexota bacterium]